MQALFFKKHICWKQMKSGQWKAAGLFFQLGPEVMFIVFTKEKNSTSDFQIDTYTMNDLWFKMIVFRGWPGSMVFDLFWTLFTSDM